MNAYRLKKCVACLLLVILTFSVLVYSPKPAEAAPHTITKLADTNDGVCDADCSLREGIGVAVTGDTIEFATGLTGTIILSSQILISQAITINGPGAGVITVSGNDLVRVLETTAGAGNTITINNLTIADGKTDANGAGIFNHNGNLMLDAMTLQDNALDINLSDFGGAIANSSGTLTITNSTLNNNTARVGGAIFNESGGSVSIANSTISNNTALAGGGIYELNANTLSITNSIFTNNDTILSGGGGGAIMVIQCNPVTIQDSTFSGNTSVEIAGALYFYGVTATLTNLTISGNTATDGGGIYAGLGTAITLNNVDILNNVASNRGGGIFNAGAVTIQNNTVLNGNSAVFGGGISNESGAVFSMSASILQGNTASITGGAVYNLHNSGNVISVTGSCIVENSAVAFFNNVASSQIATNNWWGASDGPSGAGSGSGDSVSANVNYSPFLTSPILGCPDFNATATPTSTPVTPTNTPSSTPIPPTNTPTNTSMPPTNTPSSTPIPPTNTPTSIPLTPTNTTMPPTITLTNTPLTPTLTFTPAVTTCAIVVVPPNLISPAHRAHTTDHTPTFTWSSVTGAQSYRLMVYLEDRSFEYKKRTFNTNYTLTAAEALNSAKYLWRVRTQDLGCSTWTVWSTRNTLFVD